MYYSVVCKVIQTVFEAQIWIGDSEKERPGKMDLGVARIMPVEQYLVVQKLKYG